MTVYVDNPDARAMVSKRASLEGLASQRKRRTRYPRVRDLCLDARAWRRTSHIRAFVCNPDRRTFIAGDVVVEGDIAGTGA